MLYLTVSLTTPMSVWLTLAVKENNNSNVKKKKKDNKMPERQQENSIWPDMSPERWSDMSPEEERSDVFDFL